MIVSEPIVEKPSFLKTIAPKKVQEAVSTVKKDVKDFAVKSSAVDVALGVLVGAAVTPLVTSLVHDVVVPPFALLLGGRELGNMHWVLKDGPTPGDYKTIEAARKDGAVIVRYGTFIQSIVNCTIILGVTYGFIRLTQEVRKEGGIKKFVRKQTSSAEAAVGRLVKNVSTTAKPKPKPQAKA